MIADALAAKRHPVTDERRRDLVPVMSDLDATVGIDGVPVRTTGPGRRHRPAA